MATDGWIRRLAYVLVQLSGFLILVILSFLVIIIHICNSFYFSVLIPLQILPGKMLDFLDAPVPFIVSTFFFIYRHTR